MKFIPSFFRPAINMPSRHVIEQPLFRPRQLTYACRRCLFLAKAASLRRNYLLLVGAVSPLEHSFANQIELFLVRLRRERSLACQNPNKNAIWKGCTKAERASDFLKERECLSNSSGEKHY